MPAGIIRCQRTSDMKRLSIILFFNIFLCSAGALPAQDQPKNEAAVSEADSSAEMERLNDDVRYENAYQLLKLKKKDKALSLFGEYLELFPEGSHRRQVLRHIGDIYLDRFDYKKAIKYYQMLYEEFGSDDEGVAGYFQTGICYSRMGSTDKAVEIYKNIIELYPASPYMQKAKTQLDIEELVK